MRLIRKDVDRKARRRKVANAAFTVITVATFALIMVGVVGLLVFGFRYLTGL